MMAGFEGIHPDEGTIHAWLDDALDAPDATRVEAHVAECASCAERVAEARGLIAGASRVVGLLDERPLPLVRPAMSPTNGTDLRTRRWMRATPTRAAIAAALIVAVGLTVTRERGALDSPSPAAESVLVSTDAPAPPPMSPLADASAPQAEAQANDSMLASAVAKRVAQDQPTRGIGAAPGVGVPQATPVPSANVPTLNSAPARDVAAGRAAADFNTVVASAASADKVASRTQVAQIPGAGCYRLTTPDTGAATWGGMVLPTELALSSTPATSDSSGPRYAVTGIQGGFVGTWARLPGDQLSLRLRGLGYTTVGALAPAGQEMKGYLSAQPMPSLSEVVVTATASARRAPPDTQPRPAAVSSTPTRAPTETRVASARKESPPDTRRLQVVATRIDCPNR